MRSSAAGWLLPVLLVAAMSGCTSAPPTPAPVDQAAIGATIEGITTAFTAAVAARDTNAIGNMYADDARLMPPNSPRVDGKDAIRSAWAGFVTIPGMELVPTGTEKLISEAGDMVVELGTYTFKFQDPTGKAQTDNGKFVTVYKKVNGEWKIVVDTFNSDIPVPGM
ncbi:MAG: YybH family protein [Candidatus Eiseniibacteriota bacterium]